MTSIDDKFTLIRHDPPPFPVNSLLPGSTHCAFPPWRYLPWTPPVSPSAPLPALSTHYVVTFTCIPPDWHLIVSVYVFRIAELFRFGEAYRLRSIPEKRGKWKERVGRTMSTLRGMVGQQPNDKKQRRLVVFNGGRTPPPHREDDWTWTLLQKYIGLFIYSIVRFAVTQNHLWIHSPQYNLLLLLMFQHLNYMYSGGSRNFKTGGGARSRRGRIFRSGVCFDAPSHISYVFVARVVNKIHNVNIVYWLNS